MAEDILAQIQQALAQAWEQITGGAQDVLNWLYYMFKDVFDRLAQELGNFFANIWDWIDKNIASPMRGALEQVWQWLVNIGETIANAFGIIWNKIQDGAAWLWEQIMAGWEALKNGAAWLADQIRAGFEGFVNWVKDGINWIAEKVKEGAHALWDWLKEKFTELGQKIWDGLQTVGKAFGDFIDTVRSKIQEGFNIVVNTVKSAIETVAGWVTSAVDRIREAFEEVGRIVWERLEWLWQRLQELGQIVWRGLMAVKEGIEWLGKKLVALAKVIYYSFQLAVIWIAFTFGTPPDIALGYMYGLAAEAARAGAEGLAQFYAEWRRQWEGLKKEFEALMAELKKALEELISA